MQRNKLNFFRESNIIKEYTVKNTLSTSKTSLSSDERASGHAFKSAIAWFFSRHSEHQPGTTMSE